MSLDLEPFAEGLGFPEGPVAMADGSVLFVDIEKQTLCRVEEGKKPQVVTEIPGGPNGVAIGKDGAAYVCNNGGVYSFTKAEIGGQSFTIPAPGGPPKSYKGGSIQRVDLDSGSVTDLYKVCDGRELLSPDDIVFDASGGFYFTDSGIQYPDSLKLGGLYYAQTDRESIKRVATIPTANGVGLSPDGKTIYVSDTIYGRLWALKIKKPGEVEPETIPTIPGNVMQTLPSFEMGQMRLPQWVDSLKVEEGGNICVGTIINGGITVFAPDGTTEHVAVPDLFVTNLCFGGADMTDVWITASGTGRIYKAQWPRPGLKLAFNA